MSCTPVCTLRMIFLSADQSLHYIWSFCFRMSTQFHVNMFLTSWTIICVKCQACISSSKGILPAIIREGWGRSMKMYAHMLFTSASHPTSPLISHIHTPGNWYKMAWSWLWAAFIRRQNHMQYCMLTLADTFTLLEKRNNSMQIIGYNLLNSHGNFH